jgi:Flp pilus assembly protein TadD
VAQEVLNANPGNVQARLLVVRGLVRQGEVDRAAAAIKDLAAKYPDAPAVLVEQGMIAGSRGDVAGARASFERALKTSPNDVDALLGLVSLDLAAGRTTDAVGRIDAALAKGTPGPSLLMVAARTYASVNDTARAEAILRRIIQSDPSSLGAYDLLARIYMTQGRVSDALTNFEKVTQGDPRQVSAQTMVATLLEAQRRVDEAVVRYEDILKIDPAAPVPANNLAWIYAERGELVRALQLARVAHNKLPGDPRVNDTLGWVYVKQKLYEMALAPLQKSVSLRPDNAQYHYHLGVAYAGLGQKGNARKSLERALQLQSNFDGADDARQKLKELG